MLLAAGANPNAKAPDGSTPLHQAVRRDRWRSSAHWSGAGAKLDATNKDNLTPLQLAEKPEPPPPPRQQQRDATGRVQAQADTREEVIAALRELMGLGPDDPAPRAAAGAGRRPTTRRRRREKADDRRRREGRREADDKKSTRRRRREAGARAARTGRGRNEELLAGAAVGPAPQCAARTPRAAQSSAPPVRGASRRVRRPSRRRRQRRPRRRNSAPG